MNASKRQTDRQGRTRGLETETWLTRRHRLGRQVVMKADEEEYPVQAVLLEEAENQAVEKVRVPLSPHPPAPAPSRRPRYARAQDRHPSVTGKRASGPWHVRTVVPRALRGPRSRAQCLPAKPLGSVSLEINTLALLNSNKGRYSAKPASRSANRPAHLFTPPGPPSPPRPSCVCQPRL